MSACQPCKDSNTIITKKSNSRQEISAKQIEIIRNRWEQFVINIPTICFSDNISKLYSNRIHANHKMLWKVTWNHVHS